LCKAGGRELLALDFNVLEQLSATKWGHFVTPLDRGLLYRVLFFTGHGDTAGFSLTNLRLFINLAHATGASIRKNLWEKRLFSLTE